MLVLLAALPAQAAVLTVESAGPGTVRGKEGDRRTLSVETEFASGDRVSLDAGARARLDFARHGFLDLGPGSEVTFERLPFASYDNELRSVFRLNRGYLRMVWKHPQISSQWPLYVYLGEQRVSLGVGEYFFEREAEGWLVCVASGAANLSEGALLSELLPQACYRLGPGRSPQSIPRSSEDWIEIRAAHDIVGLPPPVAPASDLAVAATPAPPPVAPPAAAPGPAAPIIAPPAAPVPAPKRDASVPGEATPAARDGGGPWALGLASFADRADAEQLVQRLRDAGYTAEVQDAVVKGATWHRVLLPGFATAADAQRISAEVETRFGFRGTWPLRPGS